MRTKMKRKNDFAMDFRNYQSSRRKSGSMYMQRVFGKDADDRTRLFGLHQLALLNLAAFPVFSRSNVEVSKDGYVVIR